MGGISVAHGLKNPLPPLTVPAGLREIIKELI
jgi:hypothetical protein